MSDKPSWSMYQIWNQSLMQNRRERTPKVRENIWASELGKAHLDRFLKMKAVPPTNPPDMRAMRKFESGQIWEWIIGTVLQRAGVLLDEQGWVSYQYPDLLEVTGKLDYFAGGKPDWIKAQAELSSAGLPDFITNAARDCITFFQKEFPDGMKPIVLEIKSASSFAYERNERFDRADPYHQLQLFHYLKAKDLDEGHVVYINKDTAELLEFPIMNPSNTEMEYKGDIEAMTHYIKTNEKPPKENEIVYNEDSLRFSPNWKVGYSDYLTMIYGYKDQPEFDDKYQKQVARWNRVFKRCYTGAKMTKLNEDVIGEIKIMFPDFDELVDKAKEINKKEQNA